MSAITSESTDVQLAAAIAELALLNPGAMAIEGAARRGQCPHLFELIIGYQAHLLAEREREAAAARSPEAQAEKRADEERRHRQFEEMTRGRIWGAPESVGEQMERQKAAAKTGRLRRRQP